MSTTNLQEKPKVGVIFVKEGSCQGHLKPQIERVRSLLYEISAEVGIPLLVKEITTQDAINGAVPAQLVTQGWEMFYRMSFGFLPAIIINGRIVTVGQPDREKLKEILLNATPIKSTIS